MKYVYLLITMLFLSSCVSVRFPKELTINVSIPEHMSSHEAKMIMDPIIHFSTDSILKLPMGDMHWSDYGNNTFTIFGDSINTVHKGVKVIRLDSKGKASQKDMKVIVRINKDTLSVNEN